MKPIITESKNGLWKYIRCPKYKCQKRMKLIGDKFVCSCGFEIDKLKVDWNL